MTLVWLPFTGPDEVRRRLGDLPPGLEIDYYYGAGGKDVPASVDEVELYVLPYMQPGAKELMARMPRLRIVQTLAAEADGERTCGTFDLGVSKATRSHHFKVLREAGLTHTRAEGTHRFVMLRREAVELQFPGLLGAVLSAADREVLTAVPS